MRLLAGLPQPIVPVFWGMVFLEATFGAYQGVWPLWIEHLGAPIAVIGLILGAGGFLRLFVLAPSAAIADRIGYRRAILLARAVAGVGFITAGLATHWTHLALMVICTAVGELAFPLVQSLVAAQAGNERLRAFALVFTVGPSIALFISPLLAGGFVALFGMRAAFGVAAVLTVVSLIALRRVEEPAVLPRHAETPHSSYRSTFGDPGVRLIAVLLAVTVFSLALGVSFIPNFLEDQRGLTPATIATMSAGAALGSAAFGIAVARLRGLQRAPFLAVAIAVGATGLGLVLFHSSAFIPLLLVAYFFRGGLFSAWAMLNAALGEMAPAEHRARAFALNEMVGGVAFALGPIVAGPLYSHSPTLPLEVAIALVVVLIPLLILAQRHANRLHTRGGTVPIVPGI